MKDETNPAEKLEDSIPTDGEFAPVSYHIYCEETEDATNTNSNKMSRWNSFFCHSPKSLGKTRTENVVKVSADNLSILCEVIPLLGFLLTRSRPTNARDNLSGTNGSKSVTSLHLDPALGVSIEQFENLVAVCLDDEEELNDEIRETANKLGGCQLFVQDQQPFVEDRSGEEGWSLVGSLSLEMRPIPEDEEEQF